MKLRRANTTTFYRLKPEEWRNLEEYKDLPLRSEVYQPAPPPVRAFVISDITKNGNWLKRRTYSLHVPSSEAQSIQDLFDSAKAKLSEGLSDPSKISPRVSRWRESELGPQNPVEVGSSYWLSSVGDEKIRWHSIGIEVLSGGLKIDATVDEPRGLKAFARATLYGVQPTSSASIVNRVNEFAEEVRNAASLRKAQREDLTYGGAHSSN